VRGFYTDRFQTTSALAEAGHYNVRLPPGTTATMAIKSVLFVCAGNICRSPIAEALFKHLAQSRPALSSLVVGSAGTVAMDGNRATPETRQVARDELGLDLSGHRARNVEGLDADLILTMDRMVTRELRRFKPDGRVMLLGEYAADGEAVDDPYGSVVEAHRACAQQIRRLVEAAADRLEQDILSSEP
jgi:protein-tyrosine phosphatase